MFTEGRGTTCSRLPGPAARPAQLPAPPGGAAQTGPWTSKPSPRRPRVTLGVRQRSGRLTRHRIHARTASPRLSEPRRANPTYIFDREVRVP
ncbi:MAG: hypothetical protein MZV70_63655 [Desulfobacterales bacterium]|nr:hypothetical protein [Desulfobacterales bacterium]